jgi:hypothetical protein
MSSTMSMFSEYIGQATKSLRAEQMRVMKKAKRELGSLVGRARRATRALTA